MPRTRHYLCRVKEARLSRRPSPPIAFSALSGARRVRRGNPPKHADTGCNLLLEARANARAGSHHDARERCSASFPSGWQGNSLVGTGHAAADEKADRLAGGGFDECARRTQPGSWRYIESYFRFKCRDLRTRTPVPPPLSSMKSIPAASSAFCSFARASSDTRGPNPASRRLTVGSDSPAREASSV